MNERMYELGSKRSVIREIFEFGKKRAQEVGADKVFDFSLGNPSVKPPQIVEDTLVELLQTEEATALHGYTSAQGDYATRKAIADYIARTHHVETDPDYNYMTCGAAASLTISLSAICNRGDEVITFAPFFTEYRVFTQTAGAKLIELASDPDTFQIDFALLERAFSAKTAVFRNCKSSPCHVQRKHDPTACRLARRKEPAIQQDDLPDHRRTVSRTRLRRGQGAVSYCIL